MWRCSALGIFLTASLTGSLVAQSPGEDSYFGARKSGLSFNEYVVQVSLEALPDLSPVTSIGNVTFENALLLRAPAGISYPIAGGALTNGYSAELDVAIRLHFVSAVSSVAFQLFAQQDFSNQSNPFIEAFLGAESLGRYEITNAQTLIGLNRSEPLNWFGLENSLFDRLDIVAPVASIRPDFARAFDQVQSVGVANIQFEEARPVLVEVPEPNSLALLLIAAASVGFALARRRLRSRMR